MQIGEMKIDVPNYLIEWGLNPHLSIECGQVFNRFCLSEINNRPF